MEVFTQRLQDEFNVQIIMTSPSVPYKIEFADGREEMISNVGNWPEPTALTRGAVIKGEKKVEERRRGEGDMRNKG